MAENGFLNVQVISLKSLQVPSVEKPWRPPSSRCSGSRQARRRLPVLSAILSYSFSWQHFLSYYSSNCLAWLTAPLRGLLTGQKAPAACNERPPPSVTPSMPCVTPIAFRRRHEPVLVFLQAFWRRGDGANLLECVGENKQG